MISFASLSHVLAILALAAALVALAYPLHAWVSLRRVRPLRTGRQPLSVLVPLRGATESLLGNLDRLLGQRLPAGSEILLCVESEADPAAVIARFAITAAGTSKARLVVAGPPEDLLAKVHNLEAGLAKASGEVLVLMDADAHLPHERFLAELIAPLEDSSTGMVSAFPWYVDARRPAAALLAAMLNLDLLGTFALRAAWGRMRFANGTCMAIRHDALVEAGGLRWLGRRMLMDQALADRVAAAGRKVELHPEPILVRCEAARASDVWHQAHRWHLSLRQGLHPLTYWAFGWLRSPLVLAAISWGLEPAGAWGPRLFAGVAAIRVFSVWALALQVRTCSRSILSIAAQPLADLVNPFVWTWAWIRSSMIWHGRRYRVSSGATIEPLAGESRSALEILKSLARFTRVGDWGIQLPVVALAATLVACATPADGAGLARDLAWACLVQALLLCGGYALNDLADRAPDATKRATEWSARAWLVRRWLAALLLVAGVLVAGSRGSGAAFVAAVQVAGGFAYSVAPLRLKERGLWGVVAAALFQRLPGVALVWSQRPPDPAAAIVCSIWLVAIGLSFILEHQLEDFEADRAAGARVWAQSVGRARVRRIRDVARRTAILTALTGAIVLVARTPSGWAVAGATAWIVADQAGAALLTWRYRADRRVPRRLSSLVPRPDVRIYGAGLAGLSSGICLARWGMRVEIHEQRLGPGGMAETTPAVHSAQLDPAAIERCLDLPVADAFVSIEREWVHWEDRSFPVPPRHVHCLRGALPAALDRRLLDVARDSGVVVRFGSPLRVGERFSGQCIVATGLSRAGSMALARRGEAIEGWVASETWAGAPELHTFRRRAFGAGYGYVASAHGIRSALLFSRKALPPDARESFERDVAERLGWRPRTFAPIRGAIPLRPCFAHGETLLAGTLAGMIDPLYLSGVEAALMSGVIAAQGIVDRDAAERSFARATRWFGPKQALARLAWSLATPPAIAFGAAVIAAPIGRVGSLRGAA
jgi:ceramide glucosyltransferase